MGTKRTAGISMRVVPETIVSLDELAAERRVSRSVIIRNLLAESKRLYPLLEKLWREPTSQTIVHL